MARGQQKIQAQQKNAAKKEKERKQADRKGQNSSVKLNVVCPACKTPMNHYNMLVQHYEAKHPKLTCPPASDFA